MAFGLVCVHLAELLAAETLTNLEDGAERAIGASAASDQSRVERLALQLLRLLTELRHGCGTCSSRHDGQFRKHSASRVTSSEQPTNIRPSFFISVYLQFESLEHGSLFRLHCMVCIFRQRRGEEEVH